MNEQSPFDAPAGFKGVVVRYADKFWNLREWHSHDRLEVNLVVCGNGAVLLEDRKYLLQPGQLIWLWPDQRHVPSDWSSDMVMWIIEWDYSYYEQLRRNRSKGLCVAGDTGMYSSRQLSVKALQRMQGALEAVAAVDRKNTFNDGLRFLLYALWDEFSMAPPMKEEQFLHPKLESVLVMLNDTRQETTLVELAKVAGMTPHYLSVVFHRQTGTSIPVYRNRLRLNRFFTLHRKHPEMSLLSLALEAGFGSYAQFYRVFRDLTKQTPKTWLKATQ